MVLFRVRLIEAGIIFCYDNSAHDATHAKERAQKAYPNAVIIEAYRLA